jgi:hypothetical protein
MWTLLIPIHAFCAPRDCMRCDDYARCRTSEETMEEQRKAIANATEPLENSEGMYCTFTYYKCCTPLLSSV